MKIGLVVVKIFGGICQFLPSHPKRCRYFGVTGPILIIFVHNAATILPLNIFESELPYFYPFWDASLLNEGHFANFA